MGGIRGLFSRKKLLVVLAGILIAATLFFFLRGVGGQLDLGSFQSCLPFPTQTDLALWGFIRIPLT